MKTRTRAADYWPIVKIWLKAGAVIVVLLALAIFGIGASYAAKKSKEEIKLGVSFSVKYAEELGIDYQQALETLLGEVDIHSVRLMSYWDIHEPQNNHYDFSVLDRQLEIARQNNTPVALALGQRQPRWPECHIPNWANQLSTEDRQSELLSYLETVVTRYKNEPLIESYQLENEAANDLFGICPEFDVDFMQQEYDLIKSIDSDTLLTTNVSNQSGLALQEPTGDKIGFSIYKQAYFPALGQDIQWNFWYVPSWWHGFRAAMSETFTQAPSFVHELQAEPWGPVETVSLDDATQKKLTDTKIIQRNVDFALQSGMKEVYLWGGEWWYWRLTRYNDQELWNGVQEIYRNPQNL